MRAVRAAEKQVNMAAELVKASILGVAVSFILVVAYALILREGMLETSTMPLMTTAIKAVCAALAGLVAVRRCKRRLWLYGGIGGGVCMALSILIYSLVAQSFSPSLAMLADLGMGVLAGLAAVMVRQMLK